ncbi:MAG: FeoA family protein [Crocinitomicaceae bacterium]|jgi:ferrous iron transport protein A
MTRTLAQLLPGNKGKILSISSTHISAKLVELGFISGSEVEVVFRAPLKDPIAVELNGCLISLRLDEAVNILIEEVNQL